MVLFKIKYLKSSYSCYGYKVVFLFFIFSFFLFSCEKITTFKIDDPIKFNKIAPDGEIQSVYFVPDNYLVIKKEYKDVTDHAIFELNSIKAPKNILFPIYKTGQWPFGRSVFWGAESVWLTTMVVMDTFNNSGESTFGKKGQKYNVVIVFEENAVKIGDDVFMSEKNFDEQQKQMISWLVEQVLILQGGN